MENDIKQNEQQLLNEIAQAASGENLESHLNEEIIKDEFPEPEEQQQTTQEQLTPEQAAEDATKAINDGKMGANYIFSGKQLMQAIDFGLSSIFAFTASKIAKRNISPDYFKLTAEEKKASGEVLDECLKTINININNPWVALSIVMGGAYLGKTVQVMQDVKQANTEVVEKKKSNRGRPAGTKNKPKTENGGAE